MTGWSGLASGRSGSGGFRGVEKILGQNATAFVHVKRSQNAVGGSGAVPRVSEVPSAAWETVSVVGRRVSPVNEFVGDFCSSNREAVETARRQAGGCLGLRTTF